MGLEKDEEGFVSYFLRRYLSVHKKRIKQSPFGNWILGRGVFSKPKIFKPISSLNIYETFKQKMEE